MDRIELIKEIRNLTNYSLLDCRKIAEYADWKVDSAMTVVCLYTKNMMDRGRVRSIEEYLNLDPLNKDPLISLSIYTVKVTIDRSYGEDKSMNVKFLLPTNVSRNQLSDYVLSQYSRFMESDDLLVTSVVESEPVSFEKYFSINRMSTQEV